MTKLEKIIKDIVKQQIEFAQQIEKAADKEFIRQLTYKQIVIPPSDFVSNSRSKSQR